MNKLSNSEMKYDKRMYVWYICCSLKRLGLYDLGTSSYLEDYWDLYD